MDLLVQENTQVRGELRVCLERLASTAAARQSWEGRPGASSLADAQRTNELVEIADLSAQEAKHLREEVALLLSEVSDLRNAVEERDAAIMSHMTSQRSLLSSMAQAQETVKTLDSERVSAEMEVERIASRLSETEKQRDACYRDAQQLQSALAQRNEQVRDYRTAIEELSAQANVGWRV